MKYILGLDIGGTHIAGGLIEERTGNIIKDSFKEFPVHSNADAPGILEEWKQGITSILNEKMNDLAGIGIAMPGPFDYEWGISYIKGLNKYEALYEVNIKQALKEALNLPSGFPICFQNDAACFALGEYEYGSTAGFHNILSLTLGTGFGTTFLQDGKAVQKGVGVPEGGMLYAAPYKNSIAEDYFSTRGLLLAFENLSGEKVSNVKCMYDRAKMDDTVALKVFAGFGKELVSFLVAYLRDFKADCLLIGGSISKASEFFMKNLKEELQKNNLFIKVVTSELKEKAAILGAASLLKSDSKKSKVEDSYRKTNQFLLPLKKMTLDESEYDIYPAYHLDRNKIYEGISSLIPYIIKQKTVLIDGYAGIFWNELIGTMRNIFPENLKVNIIDTNEWFLSEEKINEIVSPYLGENDSVWGKRCDKNLTDIFDLNKIKRCRIDQDADINIVLGVGAALCDWNVPVIYFDLPKNELQYRMRAGSATNLGCAHTEDMTQMYKRSYFVDWVLLNQHKKNILNRVKIIVDSQRPETITWMYFHDLKEAFNIMSENVFRVRPWFEPGAWGGQWIKKNLKGINENEINYAWSFELITPENGLLLESAGLLLEVSFDLLMFIHNREVLGEKYAERFGDEFPIRFDFLDTVEGGNLSIQCHPSVNYIRENFGEHFTQDETYYILEADKGSGVYLGFQEDIDPVSFRKELEKSYEENVEVNITQYVQYHPSQKHDFFLIPNGTIHSAGAGNLVLEISATPYIFTFKMYDWLRLDLNGKPRPINIGHAFHNLNFERKGEKVKKELISKPYLLDSGKDWKLIHQPTHPEHFYDVHRYEFNSIVTVNTKGSCHVLMLVEGSSVVVETKNGFKQRFHYAETFVIPAAAESYQLINEGKGEAKVVKAFMKE